MKGKIESFEFPIGENVGWKYEILGKLGGGWEAEVYLVRELETGIERAAKFFFPHRNVHNRAFRFYAKKLHRLRHCPILIQYYTQETIYIDGQPVTFLVSDYVDGPILEDFVKSHPGKRIGVFQGLHILYGLARGFEPIHLNREYHGDLHWANVIMHRYGLEPDLRVLDFFHYGRATSEHFLDDVCDMIRIFYDSIGGAKYYASHPPEVKEICCGLKRSLIKERFKTAGHLKTHLENMTWKIPGKKSH